MATETAKEPAVIGFMLYGLLSGEDKLATPIEFGEGEFIVLPTADLTEETYYNLLSRADLSWHEDEVVAVPIKMDEGGCIHIPAGVLINKVKELKGEKKA